MRAFITGGTGFIGRHLLQTLLRKRWSIRLLLHEKNVLETGEFEVVWGDIGNTSRLRESMKDVDVVFHLAAALGASLISPKEFFRVNAEGTDAVLSAAQEAGVRRVVHFSSAGVLGAVSTNEAADENWPPDPKDIYDRSKWEGEQIALRYARKGLDIVVIRPGWVYGPEDPRTFKLVKAIARKKFFLISRGKTRQTPVHINDLIAGILLCSEKGRSGEVYHLTGDEALTVKEIAAVIAEAAGVRIPSVSLPLYSVKAAAWCLDKGFRVFGKEAPLTPSKLAFFIHPKPLSIMKAQQELGYAPQIRFKDGIAQTVAWYRKQGWL